ncbi:beta-ketoacyl synthase [Whalleya microplaca]|nr:beta-ketoacyl synthase [Whalleya microplaca]
MSITTVAPERVAGPTSMVAALPANGISLRSGLDGDNVIVNVTTPKKSSCRDPIAIVGIALRLPGHCNSPKSLWDFMKRGGLYIIKTPGAMFLEDIDPADFNAQFFNINHMDASSIDPQQRIMMEVVYECLGNAGIPLESLNSQGSGCLVSASSVDYHDLTCRDPEDRTESPTMGSGCSGKNMGKLDYVLTHVTSLPVAFAASVLV